MIEFSKDHSPAWLEMISAYQVFRAKLSEWSCKSDQVKQEDLSLALHSWENRDIHSRMLVLALLRCTELWDQELIRLVKKDLNEAALYEQDEAAA